MTDFKEKPTEIKITITSGDKNSYIESSDFELTKAMKKNHRSDVFIGKIIEQKVKESNLSVSQFASLISRSRTTIYDIFNRKSIDIDLLLTISEVLNYDFLTEIYVPQCKDPSPKKCYLAIEIDPTAIPANVREVSTDQKSRIKILLKERLKRKVNGV